MKTGSEPVSGAESTAPLVGLNMRLLRKFNAEYVHMLDLRGFGQEVGRIRHQRGSDRSGEMCRSPRLSANRQKYRKWRALGVARPRPA